MYVDNVTSTFGIIHAPPVLVRCMALKDLHCTIAVSVLKGVMQCGT